MNGTTPTNATDRLVDRFGRKVNYLRMSVTDRCDLRCVYCMSEEIKFIPREQLLTLEEIISIGQTAISLGVNKIRITGGEPLNRRDIMMVFEELGKTEGLDDLTLTTNGTQLPRYAEQLRKAGVKRINVSLDTLKPERFTALTRNGKLERVFAGLDAARDAGIEKIKLNTVILENRNHDEILELTEFAIKHGYDISFIEEMPLGVVNSHDRAETYYSTDRIMQDLSSEHELLPTTESTGGPSRYYRIPGIDSRIGFISPHSHNFCDTCNRVRLTAEGNLLLCLGQEHSMDLRHVIRSSPGDSEALRKALIDSMHLKPEGHEFDLEAKPIIFRHMNHTGG
ncbi:cyclic pyranopterin phosphate synthase MoaA [Solemya velum gill symbiont]|uniref:GTP 3',8-cyclase n=1 Tax=Solemya velum gill symbiont TaxID=2340 RepID=A0A0B0HE50_SOVGS|nr:GTP 3',8-cyclase MoaA [Solemya velum gill symbiont]KHF25736.1 GTP cyclohydrolase, subunit MoaA [Solemya velum gill symbiont]OOZ18153.1 cyclic pyranopterin phosphate synthase MoaA [Solemya velum gill symbiont]OOZ27740.1 cyclic pyranopterin phosphate synthase MoaA [Solemya velum gill symbiont]